MPGEGSRSTVCPRCGHQQTIPLSPKGSVHFYVCDMCEGILAPLTSCPFCSGSLEDAAAPPKTIHKKDRA